MKPILDAFSLQVDLAMEARDLVRGATGLEIPGVVEQIENTDNAKITIIRIEDAAAEKTMGKPKGTYITIESQKLLIRDPEVQEEVSRVIAERLKPAMEKLQPSDAVLLVGLGNWRATPDALGPSTIDASPITRHYYQYAPQALVPGMRPVAGIAPGVLGTTGIETLDIVRGVVDHLKPALIIVVDSLSSQSADRLGTTIQISDTGIQPGSASGIIKREALNQETLGVPVIAIGCPMVVSAVAIAAQAIKSYSEKTGVVFQEDQITEAIRPVLSTFGGTMTVTPKEIDDLVRNISGVIAFGVAYSLFPEVSREQLELYASA